MNKKMKTSLIVVAVILIAAASFLAVYRLQRIQGKAKSEEINAKIKNNEETTSVILFTQDREFKNDVLEEVKEGIEKQNIYMKIEPIEKIEENNPSDWDKMVVLTTVQSSEPPKEALNFINKYGKNEKVAIFLTADSGKWKKQPSDVEATTGASNKETISIFSKDILAFIKSNQ